MSKHSSMEDGVVRDPVSALPNNEANAMENLKRLHSMKDQDSIQEYYEKWSKDGLYDKHLSERYMGPTVCTETIKAYFKGDTNISILDVGAGSGKVGETLQKEGFLEIDAVEPSEHMVEKALTKKVYRDIFKIFFTDNTDTIESDKYDVTVSCGAFAEGHIPVSSLAEFARITKPGGMVVIVGGKVGYESKLNNLSEEVKRVEEKGLWKCIQISDVPGFYYDRMGVLIECHIPK